MIGEHIVLHCHADPVSERDGQRSLAGLPCIDIQSGARFIPADTCGLKHCTLCLTVGAGFA